MGILSDFYEKFLLIWKLLSVGLVRDLREIKNSFSKIFPIGNVRIHGLQSISNFQNLKNNIVLALKKRYIIGSVMCELA